MTCYRYAALAFVGASLVACASATKSFDEQGNAVVRVDCSGALVPMSKCYEKALQECPSGYFKVAEEAGNIGQVTSGGIYNFNSTPIVHKSLTVRCK